MSMRLLISLLALIAWASAGTIDFSDYSWFVRARNQQPEGPGPNFFDNSTDFVWVDEDDRLHLEIQENDDGSWSCSGIFLGQSLGYGSYVFSLDKNFQLLDESTVVGMFIYQDSTHEIDIEISQWGRFNRPNIQFVAQPYTKQGNMDRFTMKDIKRDVVTAFTWQEKEVYFQIFYADTIDQIVQEIGKPSNSDKLYRQWKYQGVNIPVVGEQKLVMNFWLSGGMPPLSSTNQQVIFKEFRHIPANSK